MPGASKIAQKEAYHEKVCKLLDTYDKAFIVGADNVGSMQFQQIRRVREEGGGPEGAACTPH